MAELDDSDVEEIELFSNPSLDSTKQTKNYLSESDDKVDDPEAAVGDETGDVIGPADLRCTELDDPKRSVDDQPDDVKGTANINSTAAKKDVDVKEDVLNECESRSKGSFHDKPDEANGTTNLDSAEDKEDVVTVTESGPSYIQQKSNSEGLNEEVQTTISYVSSVETNKEQGEPFVTTDDEPIEQNDNITTQNEQEEGSINETEEVQEERLTNSNEESNIENISSGLNDNHNKDNISVLQEKEEVLKKEACVTEQESATIRKDVVFDMEKEESSNETSNVDLSHERMLHDESNISDSNDFIVAGQIDESVNADCHDMSQLDTAQEESDNDLNETKVLPKCKEEPNFSDMNKESHKRKSTELHIEDGLSPKRQRSLDNLQTGLLTEQMQLFIKDIGRDEENETKLNLDDLENNTNIPPESSVTGSNHEEDDHVIKTEGPPIAIVSPLGEETHHSPVSSVSDTKGILAEISGTIGKDLIESDMMEFSVDDMVNCIFGAEKSDTFKTSDGSSWIFPDLDDINSSGSLKDEKDSNTLGPSEDKQKIVTDDIQIAPNDIQAIIKKEILTDFEEYDIEKVLTDNISNREKPKIFPPELKSPTYSVSTERITPPPPEPIMQSSGYTGLIKTGPPNRTAPFFDSKVIETGSFTSLADLLQAQSDIKNTGGRNSASPSSATPPNTFTSVATVSSPQSVSVFNIEKTHKSPPPLASPTYTSPPPLTGPYTQPVLQPRMPHTSQIRPEFAGTRSHTANNVQQQSQVFQRPSSVGSADSGYTSPVRSITPNTLPHHQQNVLPLPQQQPVVNIQWNQQNRPNSHRQSADHYGQNLQRNNPVSQHFSNNMYHSSTQAGARNQTPSNLVQTPALAHNVLNNLNNNNQPFTKPQSSWATNLMRAQRPTTMQQTSVQGLPQASGHHHSTHHNHHQQQQQIQTFPNPSVVANQGINAAYPMQGNRPSNNPGPPMISQIGRRNSEPALSWNTSSQSQLLPTQGMYLYDVSIKQKLTQVINLAKARGSPEVRSLVNQFVTKLKIARQTDMTVEQKYALVKSTKKFIHDVEFLCSQGPTIYKGNNVSNIAGQQGGTFSAVNSLSNNYSGNLIGCDTYRQTSNTGLSPHNQTGFINQATNISGSSTFNNMRDQGKTAVTAYGNMHLQPPGTDLSNYTTHQSVANNLTGSYGASNMPSLPMGTNFQGNQFNSQPASNADLLDSTESLLNSLKDSLNHITGTGLPNAASPNNFQPNMSSTTFNNFGNTSAVPVASGQSSLQGNATNTTMPGTKEADSFGNIFVGQQGISTQPMQNQQSNSSYINNAYGADTTQSNSLATNVVDQMDANNPFDDVNPLEKYVM